MRNSIGLSLSLVLLFGIMCSTTFINDDCEALRKENDQLKADVQQARKFAEEQRKLAASARMEAERQAKLASENARLAEKQAANAHDATAEAIKARDYAQLMYDNTVKEVKALQDSLRKAREKK